MNLRAALIPMVVLAGAVLLPGAAFAQQSLVRDPVRLWPKGMPPSGIKEKDDYGDHVLSVSHREENGKVEQHAQKDDVMIIQSGEATMVYGGKAIGMHPTAPGEQQGERIEGGTTVHVGPGDVITVAAGVPHQYFVPKGGQVTYTLVKIVKR